MIAEGNRVDMIILDYIDCVVPDKMLGDEWKSEGSVMRAFEAMCHELDIAGWTATQGNRNSISSDVVTTTLNPKDRATCAKAATQLLRS